MKGKKIKGKLFPRFLPLVYRYGAALKASEIDKDIEDLI